MRDLMCRVSRGDTISLKTNKEKSVLDSRSFHITVFGESGEAFLDNGCSAYKFRHEVAELDGIVVDTTKKEDLELISGAAPSFSDVYDLYMEDYVNTGVGHMVIIPSCYFYLNQVEDLTELLLSLKTTIRKTVCDDTSVLVYLALNELEFDFVTSNVLVSKINSGARLVNNNTHRAFLVF